MKREWPSVRLSEIAKPIQRPVIVESGVSYRTIGVKWWGEGAYERQTIDGSQTAARTLSIVQEGDLIINKIWGRHGSIAIATKDVDGCAASGEFPTFELDLVRITPRWLHWIVKTQPFWSKCEMLSRGTSGKNRIRPELFLTIEIPLPLLKEQQRILARIEDLANKIEEVRRVRQQMDKEIWSLLFSAYNGIAKEAVRLPMSEAAPLVRRPVKIDLSEQYHELGIRSFGKGTFHKPAIQGADIGTKKIFHIEPDDLVFNIVFAWEGAVAVARPEDVGRVGSHRFLTCVAKEGLATPTFLCFHFSTPEGLEELGKASPGGVDRNRTLSVDALAKLQVPVPPYEKQVWFDGLSAKVDALRKLQTETASELDALLPSILDRAFNGML